LLIIVLRIVLRGVLRGRSRHQPPKPADKE
jgi:hypothetical protein